MVIPDSVRWRRTRLDEWTRNVPVLRIDGDVDVRGWRDALGATTSAEEGTRWSGVPYLEIQFGRLNNA